MLTIVTTTHNRPTLWPLIEKWMARQTLQPSQWLVINDSNPELEEQYTYTMGQDVIRRKPKEGERHSLCENWLSALTLGRIKNDKTIVVEDDDFYHARYVEVMSGLLDTAPLAGLTNDSYWNVRQQTFRNMHNASFASLATTGFRAEVFPSLRECAKKDNPFLDGLLWEAWKGPVALAPNVQGNRALHVGIKGVLPLGSPGAGISLASHYGDSGSMDWHCAKLRDWMGDDAEIYLQDLQTLPL